MGMVKLFRWAESNFSGGQSQILSRKFHVFFYFFILIKDSSSVYYLWADTYEIFLIILKTSAIFFSIMKVIKSIQNNYMYFLCYPRSLLSGVKYTNMTVNVFLN